MIFVVWNVWSKRFEFVLLHDSSKFDQIEFKYFLAKGISVFLAKGIYSSEVCLFFFF